MTRPPYIPPADDDDPPDLIEAAIIDVLVPLLVERVRARLVAEAERQAADQESQDAGGERKTG